MTPAQTSLVERLRTLLRDEPSMREVPMFGGRSFMVNGKMVVSVRKSGGLLVRVAAHRHDELLARPGVTQPEMGAGRDMGRNWLEVDPETTSDDECLAFWVGVAMDHNRALTD